MFGKMFKGVLTGLGFMTLCSIFYHKGRRDGQNDNVDLMYATMLCNNKLNDRNTKNKKTNK